MLDPRAWVVLLDPRLLGLAWQKDPSCLGLTLLSGLGAWVMLDSGIELKKNSYKKERKREDIIFIEGIINS